MSLRNPVWWVLGGLIAVVASWFTDTPIKELEAHLSALICVGVFAVLTKVDGWSDKMGGGK